MYTCSPRAEACYDALLSHLSPEEFHCFKAQAVELGLLLLTTIQDYVEANGASPALPFLAAIGLVSAMETQLLTQHEAP